MPTYTFQCTECEKTFDLLMRMSDSQDDVVCKECESKSVEKVISAPLVILKDGGYYSTGG